MNSFERHFHGNNYDKFIIYLFFYFNRFSAGSFHEMVAKAASNPQMLSDLEAASRQQQPITGNDLQELTTMNTSDLAAVVDGLFPNIELNSGNFNF